MKKPCRKSGKIKYDSHEKAAIKAGNILIESSGLHKGIPIKFLTTYRCPDCDKWHITSQLGKEKSLTFQ